MRGPERTPNLYCFHVKLPLKKTQDAGRNAGGTGGRAGGLHKTASNHSLSFSPVFVYEFAGERFKPYIEAGIGIAAFSSTELEDNDLGSSFQFEDRIGFGVRFAGQEVGLRALHYSNAGLKQPNDGVESYSLHYRMSF
jgi:lipid A 3-O-deacylase